MTLTIRPEQPADTAAIHTVNQLAFGRPEEADLVNRLREANAIILSLVALHDEQLIGHALFSPITITAADGHTETAVALGPIAVHPDFQKQGIGGRLIRTGIEQLKAAGHTLLIVLGHPSYYPRFGFLPASRFGIRSEYDLPDEVFMAQMLTELVPAPAGLAHYHPAFAGV